MNSSIRSSIICGFFINIYICDYVICELRYCYFFLLNLETFSSSCLVSLIELLIQCRIAEVKVDIFFLFLILQLKLPVFRQ